MTIDIDAFLDEFDSNETQTETKEISKKEIDLTFKESLKEKFSKLEENINEEDFEFLLKAYSEIKKFDENLSNNFFEIKRDSCSTISNIGTKYTDVFLNGVKNNMKRHGSFIMTNLTTIKDLLKTNQIQKAVNLYNEVTKSYKLFPKEFVFEKIELGKKIRNLEIEINEKFKIYWKKELIQIKKNLSIEISDLKHNLIPGNIEKIEEKLHNINTIIDKSPKIFYNELLNERIQISKIVLISEDFLKKQYEIDFKEKELLFNKLFEQFHRYELKKDINSALITYDEIVLTFKKMPDAFIEKKIEIYKKINLIFDSLNNLLLTSNIDRFMATYKQSKMITQAREYITHIKKTKQFDINNLLTIKQNLNKIPLKLKPEKVELEFEIKQILLKQKQLLDLKNQKQIQQKSNNDTTPKKIINQINTKTENKIKNITPKSTQKKKIMKQIEIKKHYDIENPIPKQTKPTQKKIVKNIEIKTQNEIKEPIPKQIKPIQKKKIVKNIEIKTQNEIKNPIPKQIKPIKKIKLETPLPIKKITKKINQNKNIKINPNPKKTKETQNIQGINLLNKNAFKNTSNNVNLAMVDEININYKKIQNSNDKTQINTLKQKIKFYASLLPLTKEQKTVIDHKLKTIK